MSAWMMSQALGGRHYGARKRVHVDERVPVIEQHVVPRVSTNGAREYEYAGGERDVRRYEDARDVRPYENVRDVNLRYERRHSRHERGGQTPYVLQGSSDPDIQSHAPYEQRLVRERMLELKRRLLEELSGVRERHLSHVSSGSGRMDEQFAPSVLAHHHINNKYHSMSGNNGQTDDDDDDNDDDDDDNGNGDMMMMMTSQYGQQYGDASIMQQMNGQTMKMVEMNGKLHMVPVDGSLWLDDVREVSRLDPERSAQLIEW